MRGDERGAVRGAVPRPAPAQATGAAQTRGATPAAHAAPVVTRPGRVLRAFAPGRTEIAGNHTDHEGGVVVAAAIDRGIGAVATPRTDGVVRVESAGYAPVEVCLGERGALEPRPCERETSAALVRGTLAGLAARGLEPRGFDARFDSTLPAGGGLSSSAAFELLVAVVARELAGAQAPSLGPVALAQAAQGAERDFFGKPCGLMDQLAVACGGVVEIDFANPSDPLVTPIGCDFAALGYAVCLVDAGSPHDDLTAEYAAVPVEMRAVARAFGAERLVDVAEADVLAAASRLRRELGDRALLRALHFYREDRLARARARALRASDMAGFLAATRASGASSAMYLQNVSCGGASQPAMVTLVVVDSQIERMRRACGADGACRIHGGGFGGSVQAFVPLERYDEFSAGVESALGAGVCHAVRPGCAGARAWWE